MPIRGSGYNQRVPPPPPSVGSSFVTPATTTTTSVDNRLRAADGNGSGLLFMDDNWRDCEPSETRVTSEIVTAIITPAAAIATSTTTLKSRPMIQTTTTVRGEHVRQHATTYQQCSFHDNRWQELDTVNSSQDNTGTIIMSPKTISSPTMTSHHLAKAISTMTNIRLAGHGHSSAARWCNVAALVLSALTLSTSFLVGHCAPISPITTAGHIDQQVAPPKVAAGSPTTTDQRWQQEQQVVARSGMETEALETARVLLAPSTSSRQVDDEQAIQLELANRSSHRRQLRHSGDMGSVEAATHDDITTTTTEDDTIILVLADHSTGPAQASSIRRLKKRSGISDQRLAEIQMIRALKKQLERASKLAASSNLNDAGQKDESASPSS